MGRIMVLTNFIELLLQALPFLVKSIWFNFHYLPFSQARKLPILFLSKSKIVKSRGHIKIDSKVSFGMIKLGHDYHVNCPNTGIIYCNYGGTIIFRGTCAIGLSSSITIGEKGLLDIGEKFSASYSIRIYSYCSIKMGSNVHCGWECLVMDTSFHSCKMIDGTRTSGYAPVVLGSNIWLAARCIILPKTKLPDYCIVATGSIVHKDYSSFTPPYTMFGGNPLKVIKSGIYRDFDDDECKY